MATFYGFVLQSSFVITAKFIIKNSFVAKSQAGGHLPGRWVFAMAGYFVFRHACTEV